MGWNGSLSAASAEGSEVTFYPGTGEGAYDVSAFTAPKSGVYRFTLRGSGGNVYDVGSGSRSPGGTGGLTVGYLLLKAGQTVYVGAGGCRCAAFVSTVRGTVLDTIGRASMLLMAGGGGEGGANWGSSGMKSGRGGAGGGAVGGVGDAAGADPGWGHGGAGGGTAGGASTMKGQGGGYSNSDDTSFWAGRGGDGYYGGSNKEYTGSDGGGGGSGYIRDASVTVNGVTYTSSTSQGQGAGSGASGEVRVAFIALDMLPVFFNGTQLSALYLNGVKVTSLIYGGVKLFMERLKRRRGACFA